MEIENEFLKIIGNGSAENGKNVILKIAQRLKEAREKHPVWEKSDTYAMSVIEREFEELLEAYIYESEARQMDEALDVIATTIRFINQEHKTGENGEK